MVIKKFLVIDKHFWEMEEIFWEMYKKGHSKISLKIWPFVWAVSEVLDPLVAPGHPIRLIVCLSAVIWLFGLTHPLHAFRFILIRPINASYCFPLS